MSKGELNIYSNPCKRHRFPADVILLAVRRSCRYPLSYRDVRDMLAERGIVIDAAAAYRWIHKFDPEIARRTFGRRGWRGLDWHVDETNVRVGVKWCYLWRAVDHWGQLIDFRLTERRDAKAARAFLRQPKDNARLYQPLVILTDKAPTYVKVIREINQRREPGDAIIHIDKKWKNNRVESDYATLKRIIYPGKGFQSLRMAKAPPQGVEAMLAIKRGYVHDKTPMVPGEITFVSRMFGLAA